MLLKVVHYYKELIWQNRSWFLAVSAVFVLGSLAGVAVSLANPHLSEEMLKSYARSVSVGIKDGWPATVYIFQRNLAITSLASLVGLFFGIAPLFVAFINGALLGIVLNYPKIYSIASPFYIIALLVPHGILEYFATFLALAFGLRLGINWTLVTSAGRRREIFFKNFRELLAIICLVVILLFIAAFIEGFLTKRIADCLFGSCQLKL